MRVYLKLVFKNQFGPSESFGKKTYEKRKKNGKIYTKRLGASI